MSLRDIPFRYIDGLIKIKPGDTELRYLSECIDNETLIINQDNLLTVIGNRSEEEFFEYDRCSITYQNDKEEYAYYLNNQLVAHVVYEYSAPLEQAGWVNRVILYNYSKEKIIMWTMIFDTNLQRYTEVFKNIYPLNP